MKLGPCLYALTALLVLGLPTLAVGQTEVTIDFSGLPAGTILNTVDGSTTGGDSVGPIGINGFNPDLGNVNAAIIFDSSDPTGGDFDLGTPNEDFGGPGIGEAGEAGEPNENAVPLGNIAIIAEDLQDRNGGDGLVDDPDDADVPGAMMTFDFTQISNPFNVNSVSILSITGIDIEIEQGELPFAACFFTPDQNPAIDRPFAKVDIGNIGNNGVKVLDMTEGSGLPVAGVGFMVIEINGSGALDNIKFLIDAAPCIDIRKNAEGPDEQIVARGDSADFEIVVENCGDVALTDVEVTDDLVAGCEMVIGNLAPGEKFTYTCTAQNVQDTFTNIACVTANSPSGPVDDCDPSTVKVADIDIRKGAEGDDQKIVIFGNSVDFEIVVKNTGDVPLTDVEVTDFLTPDCDQVIGNLAPGESFTYTCTSMNVTSGFTNTACVAGKADQGAVTVEDCDDCTVQVARLLIFKSPEVQTICIGDDANDDAEFTITVQNAGEVTLNNVVVSDPLAPNCNNSFASLAPGQSETYMCTRMNVTSGFTNVATAMAMTTDGQTVMDVSPGATVEAASIMVTKTTSTPSVPAGSDVDFTVVITNNGEVPLTDILVDDQTFDTGGAPIFIPLMGCEPTFPGLAVGQSVTFTCTAQNVPESFVNKVTVTGKRNGVTCMDMDEEPVMVDPCGPPVVIIDPPNQIICRDFSAAFTITVQNPNTVPLTNVTVDSSLDICDGFFASIPAGGTETIVCSVTDVQNGFTLTTMVDALCNGNPVMASAQATVQVAEVTITKSPDVQSVPIGGTANFTITVQNTGEVALTNVEVMDPMAPDCSMSLPDLAPGQTSTYGCSQANVTQPFVNTATVLAMAGSTLCTDVDFAQVNVDPCDPPDVTIIPENQIICRGFSAAFTITVFNPNSVPLTNVNVDSNVAGCDAFFASIAPGSFETVTCSVTNVQNGFTNTVNVTGLCNGMPVSASASASVQVADVMITKDPATQTIPAGGTADFNITVTNTGEVPLTNIQVVDPQAPNCNNAAIPDLMPGASNSYGCSISNVNTTFTNVATVTAMAGGTTCTDSDSADVVVDPCNDPIVTITPENQIVCRGFSASFLITVQNPNSVPLTNVNVTSNVSGCSGFFASIPAGGSETITCSATNVQNQIINTVTVNGLCNGGPVSATATATVQVAEVMITKNPLTQTIPQGGTANFSITVTNTGEVPLTNIQVNDPLAPNCSSVGIPDLNPGDSNTYPCTLPGVMASFTNTATVTAFAGGTLCTDTDFADVVVDPCTDPIVTITPENQIVCRGFPASFTVTVTNPNTLPITNVSVNSNVTGCNNFFASIGAGQSETFSCSAPNVHSSLTNTVTVSALCNGNPVSASDTAMVQVADVSITKDPETQTINAGETANFTITVLNNGEVPLQNVQVMDPMAPNCNMVIGPLGVGGSQVYACSLPNVQASFTNVAMVTGTAGGVTCSDADSAMVIVDSTPCEPPLVTITPSVQTVCFGDLANFQIMITNPNSVPLINVMVDSTVDACDQTIPTIAAGQTATIMCSTPVFDTITNTVTVNANCEGSGPPVMATAGPVTVEMIDIAINKTALDGTDLQFVIIAPPIPPGPPCPLPITPQPGPPLGPILDPGDVPQLDCTELPTGSTSADFRIVVTNTGDFPLENVSVVDPGLTCDPVPTPTLAPGQSFTITCTGPPTPGTNTALATGQRNNVFCTATDSSQVETAGIDIRLNADGFDNQDVLFGRAAAIEIEVTNIGSADLTNVDVSTLPYSILGVLQRNLDTDNPPDGVVDTFFQVFYNGNDPFDDSIPGVDAFPFPSSTDGCDLLVGSLLAGQSMSFNCFIPTVPGSNGFGQDPFLLTDVNSIGCVTANPVNGPAIQVFDIDCSLSSLLTPSVDLRKNLEDSTLIPPMEDIVQAVPGQPTEIPIVAVNNGSVPLTNVIITDVVITDPDFPFFGIPCPAESGVPGPDLLPFPICNFETGQLVLGQEAMFTCTIPADAFLDTVTNQARADIIVAGVTIPFIDCDLAKIEVNADPVITIRKNAPGPDIQTIPVGGTAMFEIEVCNPNTVPLFNVEISDLLVPSCEQSIPVLAAGTCMTFLCEVPGLGFGFTNEVCVDAQAPDGSMLTQVCDPSTVEVIDIMIDKHALDGTDQQIVQPGGTADFEIVVTNTGEETLMNIVVTDLLSPSCNNSNIPDLAPGQSFTYLCSVPGVTTSFTNEACVEGSRNGVTVTDCDPTEIIVDNGCMLDIRKCMEGPDSICVQRGDDVDFEIAVTNICDIPVTNIVVTDTQVPACNNMNIPDLQPGESFTYTCTATSVFAGFVNVATVTGDSGVTGLPVQGDSDSCAVEVVDILIRKEIKGPDSRVFARGTPVDFEIEVCNTGEVPLTNVMVTDMLAPDCVQDIGPLAVGECFLYTCAIPGEQVQNTFTNVACVTGEKDGVTATDCDPSTVEVIDIDIRKNAEGPDTTMIPPGGTALFEIVVTNTGDEDLVNVNVTDILAPDCDMFIGPLAAGASVTYTCSVPGVTEPFTNEACVEGEREGVLVGDCDPSEVVIIENTDCCENGNKPAVLTMRYTGEDCSATDHQQDSNKVECMGDPGFAPSVFIIANDKSNPDSGKIWFAGTVLLNETFDIDAGNAGESKLKSATFIHIFDQQGGNELQFIEFHTSCSQPLMVGNQFGSALLEACPIPPPGCCDNGAPPVLTMQYTGEDCSVTSHNQDPDKVDCDGDPMFDPNVFIIANDKSNPNSGRIWFSGDVALDGFFDIDASNAGENKLKSNTYVHIFASQGGPVLQTIKFHTSCSQPLNEGDQFGAARLITCGQLEPGLCVNGAKPRILTVRYTGEDCTATNTNQDPDKVDCSGDPAFDPSVFIIANDKSNPNSGNIWFSGTVPLDGLFDIDAGNAGENKLKSATFVHIFDSQGGNLLQFIEFHTSCSQPLSLGDQFGSILLEDFVPDQ